MAHRMARHCNPELAAPGHQRIAQVWSFELKALEARFGSAVTQSQAEGAMASIKVDLSHMLKKPKGSVSIVATVPHDYPRKRPELKARDPQNAIDPELMEELVQCGATALQSAFAASGPAVFFAVDQVAALLRKRFKGEEPEKRGSQVRGAEGELTRTEETRVADKPRRRRRRRSAASLVLPLLNAEKEEVVESREEEKFGGEAVSFGRSKGGGSWSTGISTPSCISEEQSSSSSSSSDSSSESSSGGLSDDEMQRIAAQLHFNVRRQMLFKAPSRSAKVPLGSMGEGFYDAACPGSEAEAFDLPCFGAMLPNAPRANMAGATARRGKQWVVAQERHPDEAVYGEDFMSSESLLGKWVDSQGHSIHVLSTDAYNVRLLATLSKAMQPDKHLALKPVRLGAGWQCGHSILDPSWSTSTQLHWVAGDGRVTVWVRPSKAKKEAKTDEGGPAEKSEAP